MVESGMLPEALHVAQGAIGLLVLAMAFTPEQRAAIKRRDNQECQMNCDRARFCGGRGDRLNVHHVLPQAYARQFGICPDFPENGITVCQTFHQKELHTHSVSDTQRALRERRPYWNTEHDRSLYAIALRNTQRMRARGWIFPSEPNR